MKSASLFFAARDPIVYVNYKHHSQSADHTSSRPNRMARFVSKAHSGTRIADRTQRITICGIDLKTNTFRRIYYATFSAGHPIRATVAVEYGPIYRQDTLADRGRSAKWDFSIAWPR
jgi:hypothetical protein